MYDNGLNMLVNHVSLSFQKLSRNLIFSLFHTPNKPFARNGRDIATENMVTNRVDAAKYFGIAIDAKLSRNANVAYICNSLIKFLGILTQLLHKMTKNTVRQFCHAFVYSKIKYGWKYMATLVQEIFLNYKSCKSPSQSTRHYDSGRYTQKMCNFW